MSQRQFFAILLLNAAGVALFFSWYLPANHGFWFTLDSAIFFYFNQHLATSSLLLYMVAITNNRAFDACALLAMGLLYFYHYQRGDSTERQRLLIIGVVMLITAVVLNQLGHLLPVQHASPTYYFSDINRVGELTGWPTKDASRDSFPGDHGMMLMIYSAFMLRYFPRRSFLISLVIVVVFTAPRVMIGAHWFTDIAVGSLSVVLVALSWWLISPASDAMINFLHRSLPARYRR
ncbi:phosphatase PAP2 family protein [Symbiopectobacterium sp. Eva_TO]